MAESEVFALKLPAGLRFAGAGRKLRSKEVRDALAEAPWPNEAGRAKTVATTPKLKAGDVQGWLREMEIATIFIQPDSPCQNSHVKSFHNRLRDEYINYEIPQSVTEARMVIEEWSASTTASTGTGTAD